MNDATNQSHIWIFQYHPDGYDLTDFVAHEGQQDHWPAKHQRSLMQPNQLVYILRAGGREGGSKARLEALGRFVSAAYANYEFDATEPFRINIRYESWIEPPLDRETMRSDLVLGVYHPLSTGLQATIF